MKPRVGLAGAGRVKDPAAAGRAAIAAATQKAGAPRDKGKAVAVAGVAAAAAAEGTKPEVEVKPEVQSEAPVEAGRVVVSIEVSPEEAHDAFKEHHEEHAEVPTSDVGSHDEGGSVHASPPIESEEMHYAEGSVREDDVISLPPQSGSEHEYEHEHEHNDEQEQEQEHGHEHEHEHEHEHKHEHPGEEEHRPPQISKEQQEELLTDDVPALPEPSETEVAESAAHASAEEHLEKVVPPFQPSVLPTGEQVDEEMQEIVEEIPTDA